MEDEIVGSGLISSKEALINTLLSSGEVQLELLVGVARAGARDEAESLSVHLFHVVPPLGLLVLLEEFLVQAAFSQIF